MSGPLTHILVTVPYGSLTREQEQAVRDVAQRLTHSGGGRR